MRYLSVFLTLQLLTFLICRPLRISSWDKALSTAETSLVTKGWFLSPHRPIQINTSQMLIYGISQETVPFTKRRHIIRTKETLFFSDVIKIFREASKDTGHFCWSASKWRCCLGTQRARHTCRLLYRKYSPIRGLWNWEKGDKHRPQVHQLLLTFTRTLSLLA